MKLFGSRPKNQFAPRTISMKPEQHSGKKLFWIVLSIVIVLGLVFAAWQYAKSSIFVINEVKLIETIGVQPDVVPRDQMSKLAKLIEGTSLLTLDVERMDKEWREKFPSVTVFEIIKKYPQTLEVRYTPRVAYSQLASPDGVFLADRNGYIFAEASSTALPKLTTDASVSEVGKTASAEGIMLGMYLIKGLRNTTPRLQSIVLEEGQLEVKLASSTLILINEERDAVPTTEQIQTLLAKFEQDKKYPKEIDMRFDRPVLRY